MDSAWPDTDPVLLLLSLPPPFQRLTLPPPHLPTSQSWLSARNRPVVIKPQGTGCGHGIEFFFGDESRQEIEEKVRVVDGEGLFGQALV